MQPSPVCQGTCKSIVQLCSGVDMSVSVFVLGVVGRSGTAIALRAWVLQRKGRGVKLERRQQHTVEILVCEDKGGRFTEDRLEGTWQSGKERKNNILLAWRMNECSGVFLL